MKNYFAVIPILITLFINSWPMYSGQPLVPVHTKSDTSVVLTNEQKFFHCIYQQYPDDYFPLGSASIFSESYNAKTNKLIWKFSFLVVDSAKADEAKYLKEINDTILKKYLPSVHLYFGTHSHHYEVGSQADFIGFLYNDKGDFLFSKTTPGFNKEFIRLMKSVSIPGKEEKEKFCSSLAEAIAPELLFRKGGYINMETIFTWSATGVTVTKKYKQGANIIIPSGLHISFTADTISAISLE